MARKAKGCGLKDLENMDSKVQGSWDSFLRAWFGKIAPYGLLRYLLQVFGKLFPWAHVALPVQAAEIQTHLAQSTGRQVLHAKKRLGMLARILFAFIPSRFQQALWYLNTMCQNSVPEETLKTPVNPSGKGSKRKQDDLAMEEHECWVETLQQELPDDDDPDDPSYEPTKSETDSEEYKSQNDTETDLEVEEKNGVVVIKEHSKEGPNGEDENTAGAAESGAQGGGPLELRTCGDGREDPRQLVLKRIGYGRAIPKIGARRSLQSQAHPGF